MNFDDQLDILKGLGENWDSYGGSAPLEGVIENAVKLQNLIGTKFVYLPDRVTLCATPYGTVVMDYVSGDGRNLVSIEVGQHSVGWFVGGVYKEPVCRDMTEGVETDFESIPKKLEETLWALERNLFSDLPS